MNLVTNGGQRGRRRRYYSLKAINHTPLRSKGNACHPFFECSRQSDKSGLAPIVANKAASNALGRQLRIRKTRKTFDQPAGLVIHTPLTDFDLDTSFNCEDINLSDTFWRMMAVATRSSDNRLLQPQPLNDCTLILTSRWQRIEIEYEVKCRSNLPVKRDV